MKKDYDLTYRLLHIEGYVEMRLRHINFCMGCILLTDHSCYLWWKKLEHMLLLPGVIL